MRSRRRIRLISQQTLALAAALCFLPARARAQGPNRWAMSISFFETGGNNLRAFSFTDDGLQTDPLIADSVRGTFRFSRVRPRGQFSLFGRASVSALRGRGSSSELRTFPWGAGDGVDENGVGGDLPAGGPEYAVPAQVADWAFRPNVNLVSP